MPRRRPLITATRLPASPSLAARRPIASSQVISANPPVGIPRHRRLDPPRVVEPLERGLAREQSLPWLTGCSGLPSSLTARPSRVRTCTPHPVGHSVQVLAYQVATPGTWSSDCTR